jgi:hypothetical protein
MPCRHTASRIGCGSRDRQSLALFFQNRVSTKFAVDIHPAARIRPRHHARSRDRAGDRRDGRRRQQRLDPAVRDPRRHGQGGRRSSSEDLRRRADQRRRQNPRQYPRGSGRESRRRQRGAGTVPPHTTVAGVPAKVVGRPSPRTHRRWTWITAGPAATTSAGACFDLGWRLAIQSRNRQFPRSLSSSALRAQPR